MVTSSARTAALSSTYLLRAALNYWVSNDVACSTFEALVIPVAVEYPRDSSPVGYTPIPVIEVLSPRIEIYSPAGSRARDDPPSMKASSSLEASRIRLEVIE